jgi:hypothetical protein
MSGMVARHDANEKKPTRHTPHPPRHRGAAGLPARLQPGACAAYRRFHRACQPICPRRPELPIPDIQNRTCLNCHSKPASACTVGGVCTNDPTCANCRAAPQDKVLVMKRSEVALLIGGARRCTTCPPTAAAGRSARMPQPAWFHRPEMLVKTPSMKPAGPVTPTNAARSCGAPPARTIAPMPHAARLEHRPAVENLAAVRQGCYRRRAHHAALSGRALPSAAGGTAPSLLRARELPFGHPRSNHLGREVHP